ncbi:lytic transglycosylase domain-containing protein [Algicella marina]|uniref:Transglycosylase SLT domain-containing protein n=1 Tax=Algicella marina TaxID=2683284 RepID=A0A6P1T225_9RHOB|nr:lytic transglycosylase domain-containing protein [Algicella marina]QHQ36037.1 transglycosylase SLT domain-containing protein [Algicella marina]
MILKSGRLVAAFLLCFCAAGAVASDGPRMEQVMEAISQRDYPLAERLAEAIPGREAHDIVLWHRLRQGDGVWQEYTDFLQRNPDWPGLTYLRKRGEAVLPVGLSAQQYRGFFAGGHPQTGRGALIFARALGETEGKPVLLRAWRSLPLTQMERETFQKNHMKTIAPETVTRLENMLWTGRPDQAEALLPLVSKDTALLARARILLQQDKPGVDAAIKAVPPKLASDAGLAHDRFAWRMRKDYYDSSEELLRERSVSTAALGQPEAWANRRRLLARRALRLDRPRNAYNLASQHFLTEGNDYADLEWLAGYIALTRLDDPDRAVRHFERFRLAVKTPISLGRAGYWMGRAYEAAANPSAARAAYGLGAAYQTSFYGQLAAEQAGLPVDGEMVTSGALPDWKARAFMETGPVKAALLLQQAHEELLMQRFLLHVEESLDAEDSAALAALSLSLERPFAALKIAKRQANLGIILPEAYYPVTELAEQASSGPLKPELVKAIARQESELNPFAISPAGARGLMQLMPGTAKKVANDLEVEYDLGRLTSDPEYNARLGTAYLAEMMERYDNSVLLAAAAYNAGPHRADRWISDYGDPRSAGVDPIWWIENIPYRETRNYVMRVLESLHVYRVRISNEVQPIGLERELRIN